MTRQTYQHDKISPRLRLEKVALCVLEVLNAVETAEPDDDDKKKNNVRLKLLSGNEITNNTLYAPTRTKGLSVDIAIYGTISGTLNMGK